MNNLNEWMILPPGDKMILRRPLVASQIPEGSRLATATELITSNMGNPFPWGFSPDALNAPAIWKKKRVGVGGLIFDRWFVTSDGRFGGAPNVPSEIRPASLRYCLLIDGGASLHNDQLEENEGWAVVKESNSNDRQMYRDVQLYSAERVGTDRGGIVVSPICNDGIVRVGFSGRCQVCPNVEAISVKALQQGLPQYTFELWPEWQDWNIY